MVKFGRCVCVCVCIYFTSAIHPYSDLMSDKHCSCVYMVSLNIECLVLSIPLMVSQLMQVANG